MDDATRERLREAAERYGRALAEADAARDQRKESRAFKNAAIHEDSLRRVVAEIEAAAEARGAAEERDILRKDLARIREVAQYAIEGTVERERTALGKE